MKKVNRAFFSSEKEAVRNGFRPCGHCMKKEYLNYLLKKLDKSFIFNKLLFDGVQAGG